MLVIRSLIVIRFAWSFVISSYRSCSEWSDSVPSPSLLELHEVAVEDGEEESLDKVARWQNLIPYSPWIAPGWRAWGSNPRKGRDQILPSGNLVPSSFRPIQFRRSPSFCHVHNIPRLLARTGNANVVLARSECDHELRMIAQCASNLNGEFF